MHPDTERLVELQAVDRRLSELRGRLAALPHELAEVEKQLNAARQEVTAAKDALTTSLKERKTYEMDVDSWKEKARKYREQSFAVKSNEAYKALQQEIQHAEREMASAEDRLLERMVSGEEFDRRLKAGERSAAAAESVADAARRKIKAEHDALTKDVAALEADRNQKAASVPADLLGTYERVAQRRHNIGLSEVRDDTCTLCGVRVRPHVAQELRRADSREIFQCEACTRILYYVERPAAQAAPAAPAGETSVADTEASNSSGEPAKETHEPYQ